MFYIYNRIVQYVSITICFLVNVLSTALEFFKANLIQNNNKTQDIYRFTLNQCNARKIEIKIINSFNLKSGLYV